MEDGKEKYTGLAVLVIDMQFPYFLQLDDEVLFSLLKNQVNVVSHYNRRNVPILGVETEKQGQTDLSLRKYFRESPVQKWSRDGFFWTDLEQRLREKQSTDLIMMGLFRSECVYETAQSASRLGFNVYTAASLIADYPKIEVEGDPITDDQLKSICSLSANNQELFSEVEKRKSRAREEWK